MRQSLKLHPDSRCAAATHIEVDVARRHCGLVLSYLVRGAIGDLKLPPVTEPSRTDGLWRRTCFETFVRATPDPAYFEFNFAPSTEWAAYHFSGYRTGMSPVSEIVSPRIEVLRTAQYCELHVSLVCPPSDTPWRLGLSAVLEEANGRMSHWALAHPPGRPDFHHAEGFALDLPPTEHS